jgi:hypothetical protein
MPLVQNTAKVQHVVSLAKTVAQQRREAQEKQPLDRGVNPQVKLAARIGMLLEKPHHQIIADVLEERCAVGSISEQIIHSRH